MAISFDYLREKRAVSSRRRVLFWLIKPTLLPAAALLATLPAAAQYIGPSSPPQTATADLRAVAVLEWTGDPDHPKASRLIPVCVFDGQQLQDAGIYLARPQPLALDSEVEYQLKRAGKTVGLFDVQRAGEQQGSWVGFGTWRPLPHAELRRSPAELASSRRHESWDEESDADSGRPILHRRPGSSDTGTGSGSGSASTGQAPPPDSGRPTLHRADTNGAGDTSTSGTNSSSTTASDQPTLHRKDSSDNTADSGSSNTGTGTSSAPPPDPDRPTLHRSTGEDNTADSAPANDSSRPKHKKSKPQDEVAYVSSLPNISDPGRPRLLRGKPPVDNTIEPSLVGLPPEMHQEVAVSDARTTPDHPWTFSWANPEDEATMKADLEQIARKDLGPIPPQPAAAPAPKRTSSHKHTRPPPAPPPPAPLLDEQFRVFSLTYGSGATMVFSAHTAGSGAQEKFITLIAQPDLYGNVLVLFKSVADAAHLDDTPRMRLIDPVDALGDNCGELLFELRGAAQRQFALYLVLGGQVSQLFVTGGGPFGPLSNENAFGNENE
jgi:hypothetical protein